MIRNAYPFKPGRNAIDLSDKYKQLKVNAVFSVLIYTRVTLLPSEFESNKISSVFRLPPMCVEAFDKC